MSKVPVSQEWMTTRDLMETFSCSYTTIWRWVKAGILPSPRKLGGLNRWRRSAIEAVTAEDTAA
jgi:predicted DNA-binding transcriptional regulator AlpA